MKLDPSEVNKLYQALVQREAVLDALRNPVEGLTDTERVEAISDYSKASPGVTEYVNEHVHSRPQYLGQLPDFNKYLDSINDDSAIQQMSLSDMLRDALQRKGISNAIDEYANRIDAVNFVKNKPAIDRRAGWLTAPDIQESMRDMYKRYPNVWDYAMHDVPLEYDTDDGTFQEFAKPFLGTDLRNKIFGVDVSNIANTIADSSL